MSLFSSVSWSKVTHGTQFDSGCERTEECQKGERKTSSSPFKKDPSMAEKCFVASEVMG
jgi:hypothetical protein